MVKINLCVATSSMMSTLLIFPLDMAPWLPQVRRGAPQEPGTELERLIQGKGAFLRTQITQTIDPVGRHHTPQAILLGLEGRPGRVKF